MVAEQVEALRLLVVERCQEADLLGVDFFVYAHQVRDLIRNHALHIDSVKHFVRVARAFHGLVGVRHAFERQGVIRSPFSCASRRGLGRVDIESRHVFAPRSIRTARVFITKYL